METPVPANHGMRRKTLGAVLITASALGVATTKVLSMSKAGALAPDGDPQCKKDFSFNPTGFCTKACSDDAVKSQYCPTTCASCPEMLKGWCITVKNEQDTNAPGVFCTTLCDTDEAIKTFCPTTCASCSEMTPDGEVACNELLVKADDPTGFCIGGCSKDKTFCPNTCASCPEMLPGGPTCIAVKDDQDNSPFCTTLCKTDEAIKTFCPKTCASC